MNPLGKPLQINNAQKNNNCTTYIKHAAQCSPANKPPQSRAAKQNKQKVIHTITQPHKHRCEQLVIDQSLDLKSSHTHIQQFWNV